MFGSEKVPICNDDNALVNSHYMELCDIEVVPGSDACDHHPMDIVFCLEDKSKETEHRIMLNANHVIEAIEGLSDHCVPDLDEHDQIRTALRLLQRRTRQEAKRYARKTN